jgi:hypothetical protein
MSDLVERLRAYAEGYLEIHVHEYAPEHGDGWAVDSSMEIEIIGGAASKMRGFDTDSIVFQDGEDCFLETLTRIAAKGMEYCVVRVPVEFEKDWYEENGGVPQLVAKGGPYLDFKRATLATFPEPDIHAEAATEIEALRRENQELRKTLQPFGSGGNWGVVKAMIVAGATVQSNGVDLAKWLTGLNAKADRALTMSDIHREQQTEELP